MLGETLQRIYCIKCILRFQSISERLKKEKEGDKDEVGHTKLNLR